MAESTKKYLKSYVILHNPFTFFFRENKILRLPGGGITRQLMILHAIMDYLSKKRYIPDFLHRILTSIS